MPRRIDVELTSAKEDGSFTWRAAGAKQPKGVVSGSLLYGGAKVGDVVRAEADFDVEGITIVSVVPPPQAAARPQPARIEIVGTGRDEPGVTSSAASREKRGRDDDERRPRDGERRRPSGDRRPERPERGGPRPDRGGPRPDRGERPAGSGGPRGGDRERRPGPERVDRPDRGGRPDRPERGGRPERSGRPERTQGDRPGRPPRDQAPERSRPKRLSPGSTHRDAFLAGLAPEQQVLAELLLRGGIPAVRAAVAQQNQNRPEGAPVIDAEPLVTLAEQLLPGVREAEWRDRAEAAKAIIDEVGLRDLRAIVTAADASARGDDARALLAELRAALERRTAEQRQEWQAEMETCLAAGKTIRALRLSSRPPDPTTKVPADLLELLRVAAGETLGPDTPQDQWTAALEAVVASPVRRSVEPKGLPANAGPALQLAARQASGRIPALAAMLGVDLPPPPGLRARKAPRPTPPPPPRQAEAAIPPVRQAPALTPASTDLTSVEPAVAPVDLVPAEAAAPGEPDVVDVQPAHPGAEATDLASAEPAAAPVDLVPAGTAAPSEPDLVDVQPADPGLAAADPETADVQDEDGVVEPDPAPAETDSPAIAAAANDDDVTVVEEPEIAADGAPEPVDEADEESSPADA